MTGDRSPGAWRPPTQEPLGRVLARVGRQLDRAFDDALAAAGGTRPGWLILLAVKTGAAPTQGALAERVGISGPTLTHHLDRLDRSGLVTRTREGDNRRVQTVALTAAGEEAFLRLREAAVAFDRQLHAGLSDREERTLRRALETITANVRTTAERGIPS